MKNKVCIGCKEKKLVEEFNKKKDSKDGFYSYCRNCDKDKSLKYYRSNIEKCKKNSKEWKKNNVARIREYQKIWDKNNFRTARGNLNIKMFSLARGALKKGYNSPVLRKMTGYSPQELRNHFEFLFADGMDWSNYGLWEIDHIKPICSFDYDSPNDSEFQECWSLSNLQPLWHEDNVKKGRKMPEQWEVYHKMV